MSLSLVTHSFDTDASSFIVPSWSDLQELTYGVATGILASGARVDRVITLAKGGWPMTRSLVDFLGVKEVASIGVRFYSGIDDRLEEPQIYQELPVSIRGESVVLFDDVADTGDSLLFVTNHLLEQGVANVVTATQFYKPHSKVRPDFFGSETTSWIIFPYEVFDSMQLLHTRWSAKGVSKSEILSRFGALGFARGYIESFDTNLTP